MTYVARLYGWDRNGPKIETAFRAAFKALLRRREIVAEGDWLLLPASTGSAEVPGGPI
jgi:hypothetical protein